MEAMAGMPAENAEEASSQGINFTPMYPVYDFEQNSKLPPKYTK
jgi:hypothetical protein